MATDIPIYEKNFTEQQAVKFIRETIEKISQIQNPLTDNLNHTIFQNLSQSYFDNKVHVKAMGSELLRLNYASVLDDVICKFNEVGFFKNDSIWFSTYYALNGFWNYCDGNQEIANSILNTKLPNLLISNVLHQPYVQNLKTTNVYYVMKASVSIIHNVVRVPGYEGIFQSSELKEGLIALIRINNSDFLGLVSILTLACLVKENELHLLEEGKNSINLLIGLIRSAMESKTKRINGFSIWELVNGLKCVSANDNMKKSIVKENGIQLLLDIIEKPSCDDDIEKCLGVLWNLCFDKEIKQTLIIDYKLNSVIAPFESHPSPKIKKCVEGISWLIENKSNSKQRLKSAHALKLKASKDKWKFDIFLSYSWANKSTILAIRDELLKSKINVWLDVDQMKGSTLEAMADGIETSNIFVMAISEAYRTSPNCRTEAEYAFSLKKPIIPLIVELKYKPMSWLGMIMGSKTYYEFSDRRNFNESFIGLLNNIKLFMNDAETLIIPKTDVPNEAHYVESRKVEEVSSEIRSEINKWTNKDVEKWLVKHNLEHLKIKFSLFDGRLINSMVDMNSKSPDFLYGNLKSEYGMKLIDVLKFNLALQQIN